jgi:hypothetical protein
MADLIAPLPILNLPPGAVVRFEAIDPTTAAAVAGVTISAATLYALDSSGEGVDETLWPIWLVGRGD